MNVLRINKVILVTLLALVLPGALFGLFHFSYSISTAVVAGLSVLLIASAEKTLNVRLINLIIISCLFSIYLLSIIYIYPTDYLNIHLAFFLFMFLVFNVLPSKIQKNNYLSNYEGLIIGWSAVVILLINTVTNFRFYSEPSHLGGYVVPFACLVPYLSYKFKKTLHILLLVVVMFGSSATMFVAWALATLLLNRRKFSGILAIIFLIFCSAASIFYFDTRLTDHIEEFAFVLDAAKSSNLTILVFSQGYEYVINSYKNLNILGTGLETLGKVVLTSDAYMKLDSMGYPLNRTDGGIGLARIAAELGILFSTVLVVYVFYSAYKILRADIRNLPVAIATVMWVVVFINIFLRGGGVFDASFIYLMLIGKLLPKNEKKNNNHNFAP